MKLLWIPMIIFLLELSNGTPMSTSNNHVSNNNNNNFAFNRGESQSSVVSVNSEDDEATNENTDALRQFTLALSNIFNSAARDRVDENEPGQVEEQPEPMTFFFRDERRTVIETAVVMATDTVYNKCYTAAEGLFSCDEDIRRGRSLTQVEPRVSLDGVEVEDWREMINPTSAKTFSGYPQLASQLPDLGMSTAALLEEIANNPGRLAELISTEDIFYYL